MKRLFKFMFCLLAIGLTMVSCSQDDESTVTAVSSNDAINLNVGIENYIGTRATPITSENFSTLMKSFALTAVKDTTNLVKDSLISYYIGSFASPSVFTYTGGQWLGETYYWPADTTTKLSFYAISPALDNYEYLNFGNRKFIKLKVATDAAKQVDYMFAYVPAVNKESNNGSVNLQFKHLTSQVRFAVDLSSIKEGYQISIDSIKLRNIYDSFTYDISQHRIWPITGRGPAYFGLSTRSNFNAPINPVNNLERGDGRTVLTPEDGSLLLPPQMFRVQGFDRDKYRYIDNYPMIEINCKIYNTLNKEFVVGSDTEFGKIYIRLNRSGYNEDNDSSTGAYNDDDLAPIWRAGCCYTYVLKFDGSDGFGTDKDGESHNINFRVDVEDWKDPSTSLDF